MKRRFLFLALLLTSLAAGLPAGDGLFDTPAAGTEIDQITAALTGMSRWNVVKGEFRQLRDVQRLNRSFESRGEFLFSGSRGILWRVRTPFPSETVLMEDSMLQRLPDGSSSLLDASDNAVFRSFASAILSVFSGDYDSLNRHYQIYYRKVGERDLIGLIPKNPDVAEMIASLRIESQGVLQSLVMTEKSGDSVSYSFTVTEQRDDLEENEERLFAD